MSNETFFRICAFMFGCIVGSFANVCVYRIPLGKSIVFPSSHCPFCQTKIHFYDNIPLLSYMILMGKCRHCGVYIPFRYFAVELITGLSSLFLFIKYGFNPIYLIYFFFVTALIIISFIDLKYRIIPNVISIPGVFIGLVLSLLFSYTSLDWPTGFKGSILGILVGGGSLFIVGTVYAFITGRDGIGFGDVKLLCMFGAFFGWKGAFFSIFLGSVLGLCVSLPLIFIKGKSLKYPIPFGPFLSAGLVIYVWFGRFFLERIFFH